MRQARHILLAQRIEVGNFQPTHGGTGWPAAFAGCRCRFLSLRCRVARPIVLPNVNMRCSSLFGYSMMENAARAVVETNHAFPDLRHSRGITILCSPRVTDWPTAARAIWRAPNRVRSLDHFS